MIQIRHLIPLILLCIIAAVAASCREERQSLITGGITAQVIWPAEGQSSTLSGSALNLPNPITTSVVPVGVVWLTATVTAFDITTPPTVTIAVNAGDSGTGAVTGVTEGTDRILTVNGLDSGGTVLYTARTGALSVTRGQTTDAGTMNMADVGTAPGNITSFTLTFSGDGISQFAYTMNWVNPSEGNYYAVRFKRISSTTCPATPADGEGVSQVDPRDSPFWDSGLQGGTNYCYMGWAYSVNPNDNSVNYASGTQVTTTTP